MEGHPVSFRFKRAAGATILAAALLTCTATSASAVSIDATGSTLSATVEPEFVSTGIDASQLYEKSSGQPFDFTRTRLLNLAKGFGPSYLRLGGTKTEQTFYDDTNLKPWNFYPSDGSQGWKYILRRDEWDAANQFVEDAGFKMMASVASGDGPRDHTTWAWKSDNAQLMLLRAINQGHQIDAIQFGNEPNQTNTGAERDLYTGSANHYGPNQDGPYDATQYEQDLETFLQLKYELMPNAKFVGPGGFFTTGGERNLLNSPLFGPDIVDIMARNGDDYDVVSYHQYPAFAKVGKCADPVPVSPLVPDDRLSAEFLDRENGAFDYMAGLRDTYAPGKPLWIDESGSAACGGVLGYSDTYASSFYYLNSLGFRSQSGVGVSTRWTFSGPQPYALIDDATLTPRPDYWASVIWKRLMGDTALKPAVTAADPDVRVYSHCLAAGAPGGGTPGAVASLVINTSHDTAKTITLDSDGESSEYLMTGALDSGDVSLNGTVLTANPDGTLPAIEGRPVSGETVTLPAASYAFVSSPAADSPACGGTPIHVDTVTKLEASAPTQSLAKVRKTGQVKVNCRIDGPGTCRVDALLPNSQARKLKLTKKKRPARIKVGSGKTVFKASGSRTFNVKLTGKFLKKLRKAPRGFMPKITLTVLGKATDKDSAATKELKLRLKR